jgi:hypothetical protein
MDIKLEKPPSSSCSFSNTLSKRAALNCGDAWRFTRCPPGLSHVRVQNPWRRFSVACVGGRLITGAWVVRTTICHVTLAPANWLAMALTLSTRSTTPGSDVHSNGSGVKVTSTPPTVIVT